MGVHHKHVAGLGVEVGRLVQAAGEVLGKVAPEGSPVSCVLRQAHM